MPNLNQALDNFKKAVDMGFAGNIPNSLLARQDLEAAIVKLTYRETPLRDIIKRIKGEGRAHLWNQRIALGANHAELTTELFYADGDVPTFSDPVYVQKTAAYKYLGVAANITGPMIASGRSFTDIEAEVAEAKLRQLVQAEEWAIFHGDSSQTGYNSKGQPVVGMQFDGLDIQIVTNIIDKQGAALLLPDIWKAVKLIRNQGGQPTHVLCSYGVQNQINSLLLGDLRYIAQQGTVVTMGLNANNIQTPAGVLPLIGDFFINPSSPYPYNQAGSSGPQGNSVSNVYVLNVPELEMVDLLPIGRTELAKVADTVNQILRYSNKAISGKLLHIKKSINILIENFIKTIPTEGHIAFAMG